MILIDNKCDWKLSIEYRIILSIIIFIILSIWLVDEYVNRISIKNNVIFTLIKIIFNFWNCEIQEFHLNNF